jgi:hypothetical protein
LIEFSEDELADFSLFIPFLAFEEDASALITPFALD